MLEFPLSTRSWQDNYIVIQKKIAERSIGTRAVILFEKLGVIRLRRGCTIYGVVIPSKWSIVRQCFEIPILKCALIVRVRHGTRS